MSLHFFCLVFCFAVIMLRHQLLAIVKTLSWFFHLSLPTFDICYKMRASSKTWKVRLHKSLASSSWFYKLFLRSPNSLHGFWRGWIKHNWDELTFFQKNIEIFFRSRNVIIFPVASCCVPTIILAYQTEATCGPGVNSDNFHLKITYLKRKQNICAEIELQ